MRAGVPGALALFVLLAWAPAARAGRNDDVRRGADDSRRSSDRRDDQHGDSHGGSHGGADWGRCLCDMLDVLTACSLDSSGPPPQPVVVEEPQPSWSPPPSRSPPVAVRAMMAMQYVPAHNPLVAPRGEVQLEVATGPRFRLRLDLEHVQHLERIPAQGDRSSRGVAYWDALPLSALRVGVVRAWRHGSLGGGLGATALDLGRSTTWGLDVAVAAGLRADAFFAEASGRALAFETVPALEGRLAAGLAAGPLRLWAGWRQFAFFAAGGPIPYSGPELALGAALP